MFSMNPSYEAVPPEPLLPWAYDHHPQCNERQTHDAYLNPCSSEINETREPPPTAPAPLHLPEDEQLRWAFATPT
jgi:hypothetical protein